MYDLILFENFRSAQNHLYDLCLIAKLLKSKKLNVAILNLYGNVVAQDNDIPIIQNTFCDSYPDDEAWQNCKKNGVIRLFYVLRFLFQQMLFMRKVRTYINGKAKAYYCGSYHLLMPSTFFSMKQPCYYWGLRSGRMADFKWYLKHNPFLAIRMIYLKNRFICNKSQCLFVSNEIIKEEFLKIGINEDRLILRDERCIDNKPDNFNIQKSSAFSLMIIGSLRKQKRVPFSIRAFKKAGIQNSYLILVGENKDEEYEKQIIREIAGSDNINRINKRLGYNDFNSYLSKAHFTLFADVKGLTSVTNGTMMESLINYTPIIAPNYNPYTYYVNKYGVGLLYDSDSIQSYSDAIRKAESLGYNYFYNKIRSFLNEITFEKVADRLYKQLEGKIH